MVEVHCFDQALHSSMIPVACSSHVRRLAERLMADQERHNLDDSSHPSSDMDKDRDELAVAAVTLIFISARADTRFNIVSTSEFQAKWSGVLQQAADSSLRRGDQCCISCRAAAILLQTDRHLSPLPVHRVDHRPARHRQRPSSYRGELATARHPLISAERMVLAGGEDMRRTPRQRPFRTRSCSGCLTA